MQASIVKPALIPRNAPCPPPHEANILSLYGFRVASVAQVAGGLRKRRKHFQSRRGRVSAG